MRCALAEAIIAEQLSTYIFQDFYVSASDEPNLRELTEALSRLDDRNPRKASTARYQIAMAFEDLQRQNSIIIRAVENFKRSLSPWMPESTAQESLRRDLTDFFKDGLDLWQRLRRASKHVTASVNVTSDQWDLEDARQQYDTVKVDENYKIQGAALESSLPTAVLFPQYLDW